MFDSLQPYLPGACQSPLECRSLHQGIFQIQGSNLCLLHLLLLQERSLPLAPPGKPQNDSFSLFIKKTAGLVYLHTCTEGRPCEDTMSTSQEESPHQISLNRNLDLAFKAFKTVNKRFLLFRPLSLWYFI